MEEVFRRHWPELGTPRRFEALALDARVSNQHYRVSTPRGEFLLKQLRDPNALYGTERGIERLEVVAHAVNSLAAAGLPVERLEPAGDGSLLVVEGGVVLRVFRFIEGRGHDGSAEDRAAAARAQRRLHDEGEAALPDALRRALRQFGPAYPIQDTHTHIDEAFDFVRRVGGTDAGAILGHEAFIRDVLGRALAGGMPEPAPCLVHLDFHPDNAIFRADGAVIIDLDNLLFAPRYKCVAFSALRFTPAGGSVQETLRAWLDAYGAPDKAPETIRWMRLIELEKILRILLRIARTGTYQNFLPNVVARHVPSLMRLEAL